MSFSMVVKKINKVAFSDAFAYYNHKSQIYSLSIFRGEHVMVIGWAYIKYICFNSPGIHHLPFSSTAAENGG